MISFIDVINFNEDIVFNGLDLVDVMNSSWLYAVLSVGFILCKSL
jgi:hypothetical protein